MERVTIFDNSIPEIGLFTRNPTLGNEFDLVQDFIGYFCSKFIKDNKRNNLAVFLEPRIVSGFPDIVFASYRPSIMNNWSEARKDIDTNDLKILSHLIKTRGATGERLISQLKMPERQTIISLEKLLNAQLIIYGSKLWKCVDLRSVFSITKIITVEAKIGDMSSVMEQSFLNTWFASHSYALSSSFKPHAETLKAFSNRGLGLYCKSKSFRKVVEAKPLSLPSSYQSLQFNEWIGNRLAI